MQLQLGILGSGTGSNFIAIANAIQAGELNASISLVASDLANAKILEEAQNRSLKTYASRPSAFKTKLEPEIEQELASALQAANVHLVVLAGFMRVVKAPLLKTFDQKIINIHPSLLPKYKGLAAWSQALQAGEKETGCTVHWVDSSLDGGPIIEQKTVPILPDDTDSSLHQRIQIEEHQLLPRVLQKIACGDLDLKDFSPSD